MRKYILLAVMAFLSWSCTFASAQDMSGKIDGVDHFLNLYDRMTFILKYGDGIIDNPYGGKLKIRDIMCSVKSTSLALDQYVVDVSFRNMSPMYPFIQPNLYVSPYNPQIIIFKGFLQQSNFNHYSFIDFYTANFLKYESESSQKPSPVLINCGFM